MTPTTDIPDVVTVAVVVFTWLIGAGAAEVIGPYAVIFLCALGGATASATLKKRESPQLTGLYILWYTGLALIATVPIAEVLAHATGLEVRWVVAPAAVLIANRPAWLWRMLKARFLGKGAAL